MAVICKLLIFVTLLLPISIYSSSQCNFPAVFNFGDSNSDTGGLSALYGKNVAPSTNGMTFPRKPDGRRCDGRLLIDYIVEGLGLPRLSPYLDSMGRSFTKGANFATIGSSILDQDLSIKKGGYSPISLPVQYAEFANFKTKSEEFHSEDSNFKYLFPTKDTFSRALYTFDIGQNDLTSAYSNDNIKTVDEVKAKVPKIIGQYKYIIKKLYESGARSFWIHNTGPAGCLPFVLTRQAHLYDKETQLDEYGCGKPFNSVSQYFNEELKKAVIEFRTDFPEATFTYVDLYRVKYSVFEKSKELKFNSDKKLPWSCCGYGEGDYNFDNDNRCGTPKATVCENPSSYILWDGIHTSERANRWMYDQIVNGEFSDPKVALNMACPPKKDDILKSNYRTMNFN